MARGMAVLAMMLAAAACSGASGAGSGTTTAPATTARTMARTEAAVRSAFTSNAADTTGVIALVRAGEETRVLTHGLADVGAKRPLTADDRFPVASITKSIVATAVLQYVAAGRISLDDPVNRYLPGVVPSKQITIRHLLSHRSGLHELTDAEWNTLKPLTYRNALRAVTSKPLDFPPGSDGRYSNEGYHVLGLLVEKLSGKPLQKALAERVFAPAGMSATTLGGSPTVLGYSGYRIGKTAEPPLFGLAWAAGAVVSTAQDVDRFYEHLSAGDLLPAELVREMEQPTGTAPYGFGGYGLGLWIWDMSCGKAIGHRGSIDGFATGAWSMNDRDRGVVAMVNSNNGSVLENIADTALCS